MILQAEVRGTGTAVILIPGGLTGWLSWVPHAERLSRSRKVFRVQLLNVQLGLENRALPPDYSVKTESRALASTIETWNISTPVDLVAWSYGAQITLDYALDHPERVRSLTLIEPPAFWVLRTNGAMDRATQETITHLAQLKGDISEAQLESFAKLVGLLQPGQSGRQLPQWPLWLQHRLSLRHSPATIAHADDIQRLRSFHAPVLLFKGTGSAPFLHQIIDALKTNLPNATVVELPAGHAPQIVSMDTFLHRVTSFQGGLKG